VPFIGHASIGEGSDSRGRSSPQDTSLRLKGQTPWLKSIRVPNLYQAKEWLSTDAQWLAAHDLELAGQR
jgi:hypothetical protein